ncbi:hypothetical protein [Pseudomonas putida]|uniref:hypothetical protein n=1 Tax=Pseudomonas putida TaxID=303 RepID=UPI000F3B4FC2|nr:hypothetical protein [Pseudomonas putida]RNF73178.1 hypothetical protein EFJ98_07510 [Pseudomonas putida]
MSYAALAIIAVLVSLLLSVFIHFKRRNKNVELNFYSEGLVVLISSSISVVVIVLFLYFREHALDIPDGLGQIGDFIGGLTNPILSFAALVVLLRTTSIQTRILDSQHSLQKMETFRTEFYVLLNNVSQSSQKHAKEDYVQRLIDCHRRGRIQVLTCAEADRSAEARRIVVESIEYGEFERFAISVRMAIEHIIVSEMPDKARYNYGVMVMDSLSRSERILLLNWSYYYWEKANKWLQQYPFARGIRADELITDDVHRFFTTIKN